MSSLLTQLIDEVAPLFFEEINECCVVQQNLFAVANVQNVVSLDQYKQNVFQRYYKALEKTKNKNKKRYYTELCVSETPLPLDAFLPNDEIPDFIIGDKLPSAKAQIKIKARIQYLISTNWNYAVEDKPLLQTLEELN